jgi:V8-like Glu-specific endopeptidase
MPDNGMWGAGVKSFCAVLAGLAVAVGAFAPARANVFAMDGQDPRVEQGRADFGRLYMPIGSVLTADAVRTAFDGSRQGRTRGTGFLVSPCHVLTNYHAVFGLDPDAARRDRTYRVNFVVGDGPLQRTVGGAPVFWGRFNDRVEHDWALVKLDECIGAEPEFGWMELHAQAPEQMAGLQVALAAFPSDRPRDRLWLQPSCQVHSMQPGSNKVLHDCAVVVGASGGPIIDPYQRNPAVVAIQCGELNATKELVAAYDPRYANTAVTVAEIFQTEGVAAALAADKAAFGGPNPSLWTPPDYSY